jgi:hypothetical protein
LSSEYPPRSDLVYEISKVHHGGEEVDLHVAGTNLERFRVRTDSITFVERKPPPRTSNPFTNPEPTFDAGEVMERIATVKEENLKRLDDDVGILKAYLKTQHAPKAAIEAFEDLTVEQHVSWKKAVDRIKKRRCKAPPPTRRLNVSHAELYPRASHYSAATDDGHSQYLR